jgi:Cys-tRNA(Pro) deacylase
MNLIVFLKSQNIWHRIVEKKVTIHTTDAAAATGIPLEQLTKSLVFLAEKKPILAIIPGTHRVDTGKLKRAFNVHKIHMVPYAQAEKYSGYPPGATPPIHHKRIQEVVIDQSVMQFDTIYGGGGSRKKLIELKTSDIQKVNAAQVADISANIAKA